MSRDQSSQRIPQWLEDALERVDMVQWDRFVTGEDYHEEQYINVYGWIDREEDGYKDFVMVRCWPDLGENGIIGFTTSSDRHTHDIHRLLFDSEPDDHNDCMRVENHMNVSNAVELNQQKLTEVGD